MAVPLRAGLVCLLSFFLIAGGTWAGDSAPTPGPALDLAKLTAEITDEDEALRKKIATTLTLIETELAAQRIDANAAHNLLWVLRAYQTTGVHDLRPLETGRRTMLTPDPAVTEEVRAIGQILMDHRRLIYDALPGIRQRTVELARTAEKREQIEPMLVTLEKLQNSLKIQTGGEGPPAPERAFDEEIALLRTVQAMFSALDHGHDDVFRKATEQLSSFPSDGPLGWTKADTENRIHGFSKAVQASLEKAQRSLDQSILAQRPVGESFLALVNFAKLWGLVDTVRRGQDKVNSEALINVYASTIEAARAVEIRDAAYLEKSLSEAHENLPELGADRAKAFEGLFEKWRAQVNQPVRQESVDRGSSLFAQLETVKTPAQLEALAIALKPPENASASESKPDVEPGQIQDLLALSTAWASSDPTLLPPGNADPGSGVPTGRHDPQFQALRQRIARQVLSRALRCPQLLEPPLADQPFGIALDHLARQLSDAHEWRRLLRLCEYRGDPFQNPEGPPVARKETAAAVRSYLAGQSLELGEQWNDALHAYHAVLSTGAMIGPFRQAAERITVLTVEHPAILPPPSPPASTSGNALPPQP